MPAGCVSYSVYRRSQVRPLNKSNAKEVMNLVVLSKNAEKK